jgi:SAM-dependent methyltransferase
MERESAAENDRALELLQLGAGDGFLEIGFGHGRTLLRAAALVGSGSIAGVDASPVSVAAASRKLASLIREGRADLRQADSSRLPWVDASFDAALAVHTLYFWDDRRLICARSAESCGPPEGSCSGSVAQRIRRWSRAFRERCTVSTPFRKCVSCSSRAVFRA